MVIIRFMGGLGNQMYQYALYKKFESLGKSVRADLSAFTYTPKGDTVRPFELNIFTSAEVVVATSDDMATIQPPKLHRFSFFSKKQAGATVFTEIPPYNFNPNIFSLTNVYLNGFWQNIQYFNDISSNLQLAFTFLPSKKTKNLLLLEEIKTRNSVGVHIRRTDYLKVPEIYGGICTDEYYGKAMTFIEDRTENIWYYFFSDDPAWVRENYKLDNMTVVDYNQYDEQYYDMCLMANCKHNIIANSSFSWWGAWLNESTTKIVVAPSLEAGLVPLSLEKRVSGWSYI